ncbi:MAG: hypothetical protein EG825_06650 [Rhodocyclaceae bacterium]|nr:hypothetical protein [Rhodocyclaceae bacterium]
MANDPQVSPRALQLISLLGLLLCFVGATYIAYDVYLGLTTGTIHLSRHPVTRNDGGRFWFNLIGELISVLLLLGGVALMAKAFQFSRREMSKPDNK